MRLKPVSVGDLRLNEPLTWPVYDRHGVLLLKQGAVISGEGQLRGLLERGYLRELDETSRGRARDAGPARERPETMFDRVRTVVLELRAAHQALLAGPTPALAPRIGQLAERTDELLRADTDAVLAALQIDAGDNDFAERQLHTAVLCLLIAHALDDPPAHRHAVTCAALTYDVAFMALGQALDRQRGPLSDAQRSELHRHPGQARTLLEAAGVADPVWLDAVVHHHERIDGSGYPEHLRGDAVSLGARMLAIGDIYTAMIRPRAYRDALQARVALRDIFLERGKQVDDALTAVFIKEIGIYPPGTFVRLQNGEIAVVTRRQQNAAQPALKCVLNRDGSPAVRASARDCQRTESAIVGVVPVSEYRCVLGAIEQLWEGRSEVPAPVPA